MPCMKKTMWSVRRRDWISCQNGGHGGVEVTGWKNIKGSIPGLSIVPDIGAGGEGVAMIPSQSELNGKEIEKEI